jgi:hypothetical protein
MSCDERSTKLLEHTALTNRVFGVLVDRTRVIEMTSSVSTMWILGPYSIWIFLFMWREVV